MKEPPRRRLFHLLHLAYCLSISTSIVNFTSSPSMGGANFGPKLKSDRFRMPVAEKPLRVFPSFAVCGGAGPSRSKVMLLVTPVRFRSPVSCSLPPDCVKDVDLK